VYCVLKRKAAYAKATAPSGLSYPCPLLKAGIPVQELNPAYAQAGSPAPNSFSVVEGQLPAGLRLCQRTGSITGTPTAAESALSECTFRIKASNLKGSTDCVVVLQVETRAAPANLRYGPASTFVVGVQTSLEPTLKFGIPNTIFHSPDLPRGLEMNPLTGVISGAAMDAVARCSFTVTAYNDYGRTSCELVLSLLAQVPPSGLKYETLSEDTVFVVGEACMHTPAPDCYRGLPEATFSVNHNLPEGLLIDNASGVIAGTPSQPRPKEAFTALLQNPKGGCEFKFSIEVQLQVAPLSLTYPTFDRAAHPQGKLYCIFVCGEELQPAASNLQQGNHLAYRIEPPLPDGLDIDRMTGVITGRPNVPTKKTVYTVTATNSKGSAATQLVFAVCFNYSQSTPNTWSVDQVLLWAQRGPTLGDTDRVSLLCLNGQNLMSLRSLAALKIKLPALSEQVHRHLLLEIEKLDQVDVHVSTAPEGAKHGDPADISMLPVELRGEYRPIRVLGRGGYGTVLQADRVVNEHVQYKVAIKVFHSDHPFPENEKLKMNREASLLGRIDSPNVVKLKGNGISANCKIYWLVMDYLDGKNLQELIEEQHFFNEDEACDMTLQLLNGLEAIHNQNAVHCDVKPANVMQCAGPSASMRLYKLVDLGIAVVTASTTSLATMKDTQSFRGTRGFICPEIISTGSISAQADIWSLGVVIFVVLTGKLPFFSTVFPNLPSFHDLTALVRNLEEEPPGVRSIAHFPISAQFNFIVRKALVKQQGGRYASAKAMKEALSDYMVNRHRNQVPPTWTHGSSQSGQTVRVVLEPVLDEWREVAAFFISTLGNRFSIVRIERIQNLGQWGLYQAKKHEMVRRHGGDPSEMRLFHGTDEATVPKIISTAFNRSYCGKNLTAYGQGVYFARDASYSADDTYSRPNAQGEKYTFFCRVLVGAYALGDSSLRVPPARPAKPKATWSIDSTVVSGLFDSTVDDVGTPSIFVIYHDAQVRAHAAASQSL
jgi:serine/threonine protein kinase